MYIYHFFWLKQKIRNLRITQIRALMALVKVFAVNCLTGMPMILTPSSLAIAVPHAACSRSMSETRMCISALSSAVKVKAAFFKLANFSVSIRNVRGSSMGFLWNSTQAFEMDPNFEFCSKFEVTR